LKPKKPNRTQTEKTEQNWKKPSQTKKTSQTGLNRFFPQKTEPNPVGLSRFLVFFKFRFGYFFLIKAKSNRTELKMITPDKWTGFYIIILFK
jgi:hypothetical protein